MKAKLYLILALLLLILEGCATTPKADLSKFNAGNDVLYPPIAVVMTSEALQYPINRDAFLKALKEANVFQAIEISNPYANFAMEVNLDTQNNSIKNGPDGFLKGIIIGGTLGLVPVSMEFQTEGTIKLRYKGMVFDQFDIRNEYKTSMSILTMDNKDVGINGAYRKAVEAILEEIQKRKSFDKLFEGLEQKKDVEKNKT